MKAEAYRLEDVEGPNDVRTKLTVVFSVLLDPRNLERQDAQKDRPARPQRAKRRTVPRGTVSLGVTRERRWRTFSASC